MTLDPHQILEVYKLQSKNVRRMNKYRKHLLKSLNRSNLRNTEFALECETRLYAVLYSCWSEAQFVQILHTPNAFRPSEIEKVKTAKNRNGIGKGWEEMVEIAFERAGNSEGNAGIPQRRNLVNRVVKDHIVEMSEVRNKIAHGQWHVALNRELTDKNCPMSEKLAALDYVQIDVSFMVHKHLGAIMRDLMQSRVVKIVFSEIPLQPHSVSHSLAPNLHLRPSGGASVVEFEQSAEALSALDGAAVRLLHVAREQ